MAAINRQSSPGPGAVSQRETEHKFTVRPEITPEVDLSGISLIDHDANALIAEFEKFEGKNETTARQEIRLLLGHIESPAIRTYLVDSLKVSTKEHLRYPQVRGEIFNALTSYANEIPVQIVCVHEFKRRMNDQISCEAASSTLSKIENSKLCEEAKNFCVTLIKDNSEAISLLTIPPGITGALQALGKSPELTKVDQEVAIGIKNYRAGLRDSSRLDVLASIGTDKAWQALAKMADQRLAPTWSLSPKDYAWIYESDDLGLTVAGILTYLLGSIIGGGLAATLSGVAIAEQIHSNALGWFSGIGIFATGLLLPTLIPAVFNSFFKRKGVNHAMREQALSLIADHNPEIEDGQIIIKALKESDRSSDSIKSLARGLSQARNAKTVTNVVNMLKGGSDSVRQALLDAFKETADPQIRQAIVDSKNDSVMEISELATGIAAKWRAT